MTSNLFSVTRYARTEPYYSLADLVTLDLRGVKPKNISSLSKGVLPKWTVYFGDEEYSEEWLVKLSSKDSQGNFRTESVTEAIVYEIAKLLGFPVAEYELLNVLYNDDIDGEQETVACVTKWFIQDTEDFLSNKIFKVIKDVSGIDDFIYYQDNYPLVALHFGQMIILDFLIQNHDRHSENFGVLSSLSDGLIHPTLIYDNGAGLFGADSNGKETELVTSYYGKAFKTGKNGTKDSFIYIENDLTHYITESILLSDSLDSELSLIVDKYAVFLNDTRVESIKTLLKERLNYVRNIYTEKERS